MEHWNNGGITPLWQRGVRGDEISEGREVKELNNVPKDFYGRKAGTHSRTIE